MGSLLYCAMKRGTKISLPAGWMWWRNNTKRGQKNPYWPCAICSPAPPQMRVTHKECLGKLLLVWPQPYPLFWGSSRAWEQWQKKLYLFVITLMHSLVRIYTWGGQRLVCDPLAVLNPLLHPPSQKEMGRELNHGVLRPLLPKLRIHEHFVPLARYSWKSLSSSGAGRSETIGFAIPKT